MDTSPCSSSSEPSLCFYDRQIVRIAVIGRIRNSTIVHILLLSLVAIVEIVIFSTFAAPVVFLLLLLLVV